MSDPKPALLSVPAADLDQWFATHDAAPYRRGQVLAWAARGAATFEEMREVPRPLRAALEASFRVSSLQPVARSDADSGLTTKTLYELDGGHTVEAVVMRYADRSTLCISSQARCPGRGPFCGTGERRLVRHLSAHEIVEHA